MTSSSNAGTVSGPEPPDTCGLCGSPMATDQEWCLECGAARTVIARPPDWRVPVLVIATVVLLVAGGLAFALISLSRNAGKVTVINARTTARATPAPAARIGSWAPGEDGYTVLLSDAPTERAADAAATRVIAAHIQGVGVIATAKHPVMKPANVFYVFVGRFPTHAAADVEQAALIKDGHPEAKTALVQRPGGS